MARDPQIDLVLLDLALPGMHGLTLLETLRQRYPSVSVVVVSATADRDSVLKAMDRGALGLIPTSSTNEVLKRALQLVLAGGVYVPPEVVGRGGEPDLGAVQDPERTTTAADLGLTERQPQILARLMQGESNKHRRIDGQEPDHRDPEGARGDQPHAGRAGGGAPDTNVTGLSVPSPSASS